jgi:superfamily II DNA or RNA helicase
MDNVYITVKGAPQDVEYELWDELVLVIQQYGEPTPKIRRLYNRKTKKTYTGLLEKVKEVLDDINEPYEVIDNREKPEENANFEVVDKVHLNDGTSFKIEERPYQQKIIENADPRMVVQAATGAGKTYIMAALLAKFNVKPVAIFVDKISLCRQIKNAFENFLDEPIGIVGGGMKQKEDITVYSVQSATKEDVKDAKLIMFDECHHVPADTFMKVGKWCKDAYYRIGMSATPWRDGGDDLLIEAALWKRYPENAISASHLIREGYLVPATIYFIPIQKVFRGRQYHRVYEKAIVKNKKRNNAIIKTAIKMREVNNRKILMLVQRLEHGENLRERLVDHLGETSSSVTVKHPKTGRDQLVRVKNIEFLSGEDGALRRKAVIKAVKEGKCDILIGTTIADEGLDIPPLDCLILCGGGKSSTRAYQRIGRVLRTSEDKERAIVFDFVDYTPMLRRHSRVREKLYREEEEWEIKFLNTDLLNE